MVKNEKAVVVFSGGQDSTTCLFWAQKHFQEVATVSFDYGQRHRAELDCAKEIAAEAGVSNRVLELGLINQLSANALTRAEIEVKDGEDGGMPSTFVEGRNHIFFSIAAIYAKQIGAKHLVTGVSGTDFSGYPDCRDSFIKSLNVTLNLAMDTEFVIHTPLMWLNKEETWRLADELGKLAYIRSKTTTCYHGIRGTGCGECPACHLRQKGLTAYLTSKGGSQ